jgi:hypothetical protein
MIRDRLSCLGLGLGLDLDLVLVFNFGLADDVRLIIRFVSTSNELLDTQEEKADILNDRLVI